MQGLPNLFRVWGSDAVSSSQSSAQHTKSCQGLDFKKKQNPYFLSVSNSSIRSLYVFLGEKKEMIKEKQSSSH